jgi:HEAT repeat protein
MPTLADDDSEAVAYTLSQLRTDKSINALVSIARDKNKSEKTRTNSVFWIGQSRAQNRVRLLDDIYKGSMDNSRIRQQVLAALSQTREPQAVSLLGSAASTDPDIEVRKQAVFWIGQSRSPEANQVLEDLLRKK